METSLQTSSSVAVPVAFRGEVIVSRLFVNKCTLLHLTDGTLDLAQGKGGRVVVRDG